MKLFKLLSRYSLFRCSGRCRRRSQLGFAPVVGLAAEVLEQRQLLSGNVTATSAAVAGVGSLTLTNDSGDNDINVYRLDAGHVEIDAFGGTTINGAASVVFALSKVTGITVNLGSGYDAYNIGSNPGDPALNIGLGGSSSRGPVAVARGSISKSITLHPTI